MPATGVSLPDHAASEIAIGGKLGIDATKKIPGEGFKRAWPPLIKMDAAVRKKMNALYNEQDDSPTP
jgi:4-hydroxy-3-polyprenylbenzoate decarboxylase